MAISKHLRRRRAAERRIENHPQRLTHPRTVLETNVEARVIHAHGPGSGQHSGAPCPPSLYVGARVLSADPKTAAAGGRGTPVQTHRELQPDPRAPALESRKESDIEIARFPGARAHRHCDPRPLEPLDARARHPWI